MMVNNDKLKLQQIEQFLPAVPLEGQPQKTLENLVNDGIDLIISNALSFGEPQANCPR